LEKIMEEVSKEVEKVFQMGGRPGDKKMGSSAGSSGIDWRSDPLDVVCEFSPQVAWARYLGIQFAPFVQSISGTFTNATDTIGPFSFPTNSRLSVVSVVDRVVLHIDAPNLNNGNALKPFIDWFFGRQSGIQATMQINSSGPGSYAVAPGFIPVDELCAMITEAWPSGWVLNYTQQPQMQFTTAFALPALPVTVTCAFRMWQPTRYKVLMGMSDQTALDKLVAANVITQDQYARMSQSY
jgi:hypothetical protein